MNRVYPRCKTCGLEVAKLDIKDNAGILVGVAWLHSSAKQPDHDVEPVFTQRAPKCDFCSQPEALWGYLVTGENAPKRQWYSSDHFDTPWAACTTCSGLIEAGKWGALVQRCARLIQELHRVPVPTDARAALYKHHQDFKNRMVGDRLPVTD
ncbi:hypothetical protein ACIOEX_21625 [Streptomyces sp. NPDC087850]|uniref:hypothetical protein n=1 Tax=Streptomyces sp. NPDC087850 TaxID=3365809 RepID=UPI00382A3429